MRLECPLSPYLFNVMLEAFAKAVRQVKETKEIQIGKQEVKISSSANYRTVCIQYPKDSTWKLLQLINPFSKVVGYKVNTQIQ